jgi:hypothetical protein
MMAMKMQVDGLAAFVNRLEKFDKDVSKVLKKEMRAAATLTAKEARSLTPSRALTNWGKFTADGSRGGSGGSGNDVSFSSAAVRRGFKVATNRYRRRGITTAFGYDVVQGNAGGSVFETIGKGSGQFVDAIVSRFGSQRPRTLIPAYYATIEQAQSQVEDAIRRAEREVGL